MEKLGVDLELKDKVSGPADKASDAIMKIARETEKAQAKLAAMKADPKGFKELAKIRKEAREMASDLKKSGEGGGLFAFANPHGWGRVLSDVVGHLGADLTEKIGESMMEVPLKLIEGIEAVGEKFVEAAGKEERFRISFKALLGDASDDTREYIEHIANVAELTDEQLKNMSTRLLTVGFNAEELGQVLPASLDIAGFLGGGVDKANEAAEALAHIKTTGEISKRSIGSLGLQYAQVMDELKKETGLTTDEITKKLSSGKFGPQVLHAVLQSIANREGGALGNTAEKMGDTIQARLDRLKSLPDKFFAGLVTSKGFSAFSDFVGQLAKELSPESAFGQEVTRGLEEIGDVIADELGIKGGNGIETVKEGIRGAINAAKDFIPVLMELAGDMAEIARSVANLLRDWNEFKGKPAVSNPDKGNENSPDWKLKKLGISRGMASVNADSPDWKLAQNGIVKNKDGSLNEATDYYGPSEVPNASRWRPSIPSQAPNVAGGGGGNTTNNTAKVEISVTHDGHADSDEIANKVSTTLPGAIQQAHERMAVATGAM